MTSIAQPIADEAPTTRTQSLLDPQVWNGLYPHEFRHMVGYLVRHFEFDEMTAEDIVQDALMALWEQREQYPAVTDVFPLAFGFVRSRARYERLQRNEMASQRVSVHQLAKRWQGRGRFGERTFEEVVDVLTAPSLFDGMAAVTTRDAEQQAALDAFASLPEAWQDALRFSVQGYTGPQVWDQLHGASQLACTRRRIGDVLRDVRLGIKAQAKGVPCPGCQRQGRFRRVEGMCMRCYTKSLRAHHKQGKVQRPITCGECQREGVVNAGKGLCRLCYYREFRRTHKPTKVKVKVLKPAKVFVCARCGADDRPYLAKGLCRVCYFAQRYRAQRAAQEAQVGS